MALGVAHQDESGVVGRLSPFVKVEGDGVGPLDACQQGPQLGRQDGQGAEGAIHVQPQPLAGGDLGQSLQVVDGAGVDRACRADDQERIQPRGAVCRHRLGQGPGVQAAIGQDRDLAQGGRTEPGDVQRLGDTAVRALGSVGGEAGPGLAHPVDTAVRTQGGRARGQHRDQVGHRGSGDEQAAGGPGKAEQLRHPAGHLALDLDGGVVAPAEIGVEPGRQHLRQHPGEVSAAVHPAHEAGMAVAGGVRQHLLHEICVSGGDPLPRPWQPALERGAGTLVHRPPDGAFAQALQVIQHVVEHAVRLGALGRPILGIEVGAVRRRGGLRQGLELHRPQARRFFVNHVSRGEPPQTVNPGEAPCSALRRLPAASPCRGRDRR